MSGIDTVGIKLLSQPPKALMVMMLWGISPLNDSLLGHFFTFSKGLFACLVLNSWEFMVKGEFILGELLKR